MEWGGVVTQNGAMVQPSIYSVFIVNCITFEVLHKSRTI